MALKRKTEEIYMDTYDGRKEKLNSRLTARSFSYSTGFVLFLIYICLPKGEGHIASLIGSGDVMPPRLTNPVRMLRGPTVSPTDVDEHVKDDSSLLKFLQAPPLQHKYLRSVSHFQGRYPQTNSKFDTINYVLPYNHDDGNDGENSAEISDDDDEDDQDPTFTPFIGARALSNIPKFFEHLRENLEALQQEDDYNNQENVFGQPDRRGAHNTEDYGELPTYFSEFRPERSAAVKPRWQPPASGHTHNIRSFVQPPTETETYLRRANNYNPSWLYTNLGLGKRRR